MIFVYVESVEEVSVVEESVGEEEVEEHDEQVENFAEDEPAEIYVVPEKKYMLYCSVPGITKIRLNPQK